MPRPILDDLAVTAPSHRGTFVGREPELRELTGHLERAADGHGGLVSVMGEAGIGKTGLAREIALVAGRRGVRCLWAYCGDADGAPPFWPWRQIVSRALTDADAEGEGQTALTQIGPRRPDLLHLVPEIDFPGAGAYSEKPAPERIALFQALSAYLATLSRFHPVLVVIDDLHAADDGSLQLLRFLARRLPEMAVLVVCTYRLDAFRRHPARAVVGDIDRHSQRITLAGLGPAEVAQILAKVRGGEVRDDLAAGVHARTRGNPFFVHELARSSCTPGDPSSLDDPLAAPPVPMPVKTMLASRMAALPPPGRALLAMASVLGNEFELGVVGRAANLGECEVLEAVGETLDEGLVEPSSACPGRYRFRHDIVREAVYDDLEPAQRAELHARAARAIEDLTAGDPAPPLAALAHHFFRAVPFAGPERAVHYAVRAGKDADVRLGYEDGLAHYRRALHLVESHGGSDRQRFDLLIAIGDLESKAGDVETARATFLRAAGLARQMEDAELFAKAAVGFGGRFISLASARHVDAALVRLLEEALDRLDKHDSPLRALLLARLSRALYFSDDYEYKVRLCEEGLAMGRRVGDRDAEMAALHALFWTRFKPEDSDARLEAADRVIQLAGGAHNVELELQGLQLRALELAGRGARHQAEQELDEYIRIARGLRQPVYDWYATIMRSSQAFHVGEFRRGESLARTALAAGTEIGIPIARPSFSASLFWPFLEQGRLDEIADELAAHARACACLLCRATTVLLEVSRGDPERVRERFEDVAAGALRNLPHNSTRLALLTSFAHLCVVFDDRSTSETVYRSLLPYAGHVGSVSVCAAYGGGASFHLGRLANCLGRHDVAREHLLAAVEEERRAGSRARLARTQLELGRVLAGMDPGSWDEARTLGAASQEAALAIGMPAVADEAAQLQEQLRRRRSTIDVGIGAPPQAGREEGRFRLEGEYWLVEFGTEATRVRDAKGLRYLSVLLQEPHREFHVADLMGGLGPVYRPPAVGPVLDATARGEYKRRLGAIQAELAEARTFNDQGKVAALKAEAGFLTEQLAAAYGLGGKGRQLGDAGEKMRKAVTVRIRSAIGKIGQHHPSLGAHLANSVKTGTFCSYRPERNVRWEC